MICSQERVVENIEISPGIFKLTVKGEFEAKSGQFYMLKCWEDGLVLPRPISVHELNENGITFLYAVVGKGTNLLSKLKKEDEVQIMGPLGNGFDVEKIKGKIAVVSGGIGIAPMHYLIKNLKDCDIDLYAGFKAVDYSVDNVEKNVNEVKISTEMGDIGHKGYITELLQPEKYDLVIGCGPEPMMERVINMCKEKDVPVYVSMENRMACGIGACLVCTCKTKDGNKRTCKDGPVFDGRDLIFND
ncbi:dihydroorotate dehydrogenase electron transfer subunit [Clostridium aestuarii]|nr:dihydroorotate dehydrogenase electron transfer subunit [Clostridium aestuarii]